MAMPCDHLSQTSLSCLHFASSAKVEGSLLRFLSRNFNVFSFIINPPLKIYKTVFIKDTILLQIVSTRIEFVQFYLSMLSFLHCRCEFYGTTSNNIDVRFYPNGIYPKPTCMPISIPIARLLARQFAYSVVRKTQWMKKTVQLFSIWKV